MSTSGRRKGAQFVSSPSDSSIGTNLNDIKSPRSERSPPPTHKHVMSEKNVPLPEGGTAVVFDSSGTKRTVPLQARTDGVDIQKLILDEKEKMGKMEYNESLRKDQKNVEANKVLIATEELPKKKNIKYLCKNRPCNKRKTDSQSILKAIKSATKIVCQKNPEQLTRNVHTQTEEENLKLERKLSGIQRSSELILYRDENISINQVTAPRIIRTAVVDSREVTAKGKGNSAIVAPRNQCGDQITSTEIIRPHLKCNNPNLKSDSSLPNRMRDTINVRNFIKTSRTPQRYSLVDPIHCKVGENNTLCKEISKMNKNGILRRTLTMILFTVILSWFLSAVFRVNIPGDLFRVVINYISRLPIFVKRRKRELTKAEIAFKCIGSFLRFLANAFGDPN